MLFFPYWPAHNVIYRMYKGLLYENDDVKIACEGTI